MTVTTGPTPWPALNGVLTALASLAVPFGFVMVIIGFVQFFRPPAAPLSPQEILQTRYAKGELSLSEYEEMLRDIGGGEP